MNETAPLNPPARSVGQRLAECGRSGFKAGGKMALWLLKLMVPISLAVTLLSWCGLLAKLASPLKGLFGLVGLPPETVVAFLTGLFLNVYSAIAVLGSIPLTDRQITILAVIILISHNFPIEVTVQKKTGSSVVKMILVRLTGSLVGACLLNHFLPIRAGDVAYMRGVAPNLTFWPMMWAWAGNTGILVGKVIGIVVSLMILQRILKEFGVIRLLSKVLFPVLWLLGLPHRTAFLWIVANTLGLAYGSAVMIEEVATGELRREDVEMLNRSIAICHSLLEDTLLFVFIGAWAVWIMAPRLVLAAAAVWLYRLALAFSKGRSQVDQQTEA